MAPDDTEGFPSAAAKLRAGPQLRAELGANGKAYAERTFNLDRIADAFEEALSGPAETTRSLESWAAYRTRALGSAPGASWRLKTMAVESSPVRGDGRLPTTA